MIASKQIAFGRGVKRKPYDAEIEYLESTGTQWIDTEVPTYANARMEFGFMLYSTSMMAVFGNIVSSNTGVFFGTAYNTAVYCNTANATISPIIALSANMEYHAVQVGDNIAINGIDYSTSGAVDDANSMYLFARRNGSHAERMINGRVLYFRITVNGILVRDLIPVRKGNTGYMYDRVSGQLLGNQGTGEFVLGPDIIDYTAKDYVQDGLVAMWDGIENAGWGIHDASATTWVDLINGDSFKHGSVVSYDGTGYTWPDSYSAYLRKVFATQHFSPQALVNSYSFTASFLMNATAAPFTYSIRTESSQVFAVTVLSAQTKVFLYSTATIGNSTAGAPRLITITADGSKLIAYINGTKLAEAEIDLTVACNNNAFGFMHVVAHAARFYSRALTAEEIAHNHEIDKARFGL